MVKLLLLLIILDEGYDRKISYILNKYNIKYKTVSNGNGTASPSVLDYFGLTETKKEFFLAIIPDYLKSDILLKLEKDFDLKKAGTGIAFTIPIISSNKFLMDDFVNSGVEESGELMNNGKKYQLIMTIVMEGYIENVMVAAKRAGASGGTVMKGRGLGNKIPTKILGFNIEPGKDIVLNLVKEEDKTKVMEEITKDVGIKTPGKGICISLPVDSVVGVDMYE